MILDKKKLERLVWKHKHRDYKGKDERGVKTVMHYGKGQVTYLVELSSLSEAELLEMLPSQVRAELEAEGVVKP